MTDQVSPVSHETLQQVTENRHQQAVSLTEHYDMARLCHWYLHANARSLYKAGVSNEDLTHSTKTCQHFIQQAILADGNLLVNYKNGCQSDNTGRLYADRGIQLVSHKCRNFLLALLIFVLV